MAQTVKLLKTIRNNWKKSVFALVAVTYGANYAKNNYETQNLMREYCELAAEYGRQPIPVDLDPKTITVILNPNANKRKATKLFDKYCAPILHLAGICVNIVQTESEGHAKSLVGTIGDTDAIVVAGGDGTLSEVITGLLRNCGNTDNLKPIGVLPLGRSNSVAKSLFPGGDHLAEVRSLADASMAVVEEFTKPMDVLKIEVLKSGDEEEEEKKPIYALAGINWGAFRDAKAKQEKYWYFGPFRRYVTYLFNGYKNSLSWNCEADVIYSLPCEGCSNCREDEKPKGRWYDRIISPKNQVPPKIYSNITNELCKQTHEKRITTADLNLSTCNTDDGPRKLKLSVGPDSLDYLEFVAEGWRSERGIERNVREEIEARTVEIIPKKVENGKWFSIDNEEFEVKPVRITLLPKILNMFCKKSDVVVG